MPSITIPRSDWLSWLASFSNQHRGWLVRLDGVRGGRGELPLLRIGTTVPGGIELSLGSDEPGARPLVQRLIADPVEVRVDERPDGAVEELMVRGRRGDELRVKFAKVMAPEQVDGVLPGELQPVVRAVTITASGVLLDGDLAVPENARGLVLFAHGSGSSRHSQRNRFVASALNENGMATLLLDLLTPREEDADRRSGHLRFDIELLTKRLVATVDWAGVDPTIGHLPVGLFGASTGAAAALACAARRSEVRAVVSRGGRPDLAGNELGRVGCPVLLLVGERDEEVLGLNRRALAQLRSAKKLVIVPGATHLFPEPGTLEEVARHAIRWFAENLTTDTPRLATRV